MDTNPITEMESIKEFITEEFDDVNVILQNVPKQPQPNTFVLQFQNDNRERETSYHLRLNREYRVIYFDDRADKILERMNYVSKLFLYGRLVIPIKDSLRYIRVENFGYSEIFKTESDEVEACIGTLQTELREAKDLKTYEKIMEVYVRHKVGDQTVLEHKLKEDD